jgi:hypothetical protein
MQARDIVSNRAEPLLRVVGSAGGSRDHAGHAYARGRPGITLGTIEAKLKLSARAKRQPDPIC